MSSRARNFTSVSCKKRAEEIDLALAVMCAIQRPGEIVPLDVIAEITGMSHCGPFMIQKTALKKIRNHLRFGKAAAVYKELVA